MGRKVEKSTSGFSSDGRWYQEHSTLGDSVLRFLEDGTKSTGEIVNELHAKEVEVKRWLDCFERSGKIAHIWYDDDYYFRVPKPVSRIAGNRTNHERRIRKLGQPCLVGGRDAQKGGFFRSLKDLEGRIYSMTKTGQYRVTFDRGGWADFDANDLVRPTPMNRKTIATIFNLRNQQRILEGRIREEEKKLIPYTDDELSSPTKS